MNDYKPSDDYPAIVIDNGSSICRAGLAGEDAPRSVFPSVIGRRRFNIGNREFYVGDEAQSKREILSLTYPIQHGIVTNWEDMEKIWNHAFFNDLHVSPEQNPVLISEPPLNPKGNREKMAQVMFETYRTPAFFVGFQPMLQLLSSYVYQGIVVDVGDSIMYVVPIYETYVQHQAIKRVDFGGQDLTRYLQHLLYQRGHCFTTTSELEIVREMKENICFVAEDKNHTFENNLKKSYKLPGGSEITLDSECHRVPELLFQPDGIFYKGPSLPEMIVNAVKDCPIDARQEMYAMIVLAGGSTFFNGFEDRLKKEIMAITPHTNKNVRIKATPARKYHTWIGGSTLASLSLFERAWVTRQEYEEKGPESVVIRCAP